MAINTAALQAALDAATAAATNAETVDASAVALINGFSAAVQKAVADALTADDAADQGSVDAATAAIQSVTSRFTSASSALGDAVLANTPAAP